MLIYGLKKIIFPNNYLFFHWISPSFMRRSVDLMISRWFHRIKWSVEKKEISSNRSGFVCFSPSVLPYPLFALSRKTFLRHSSLFISFKRFAAPPVFPFHLYPGLLRLAGSRYYPIAISLARLAFFRKTISLPPGRGNRPNADATGAQPAKIASTIPPGTYYVHLLHLQSETLPRWWN